MREIRCVWSRDYWLCQYARLFLGDSHTASCYPDTPYATHWREPPHALKGFILLLSIIIIYLAFINITAFIMYGADKHKAKAHKWRTPEKILIGIAAIGGSIGALLGMQIFRHKTQHPQFKYGIPAILIIQILITAGLLYHFYR